MRWTRIASDLLLFILGYTGLLSVYAGVWVWQSLTKVPLSSQQKWMIFGAAFLLETFDNWRKQVRKTEAAEARTKPEPPKQREFVADPQSLLERFGDTGMLADKLLIPDLDKWITVTGRFEGVAESLTHDALHLSLTLECGRRIHLRFALESGERLEALREGQQITAMCQVQRGHGLGVYTLDRCELIRVQPQRPRVTTLTSRSA
jgi:hypothetical protein